MKRTRKITTGDVLELSVAERIRLMQDIWDTLDEPDGFFELTDELKAELDQRYRAYKRNPKRGKSWQAVKAELLGKRRRTG